MSEDDELLRLLRRAVGEAYVKTGTEHLDLTMVRKGKQRLKEADEADAAEKTRAK